MKNKFISIVLLICILLCFHVTGYAVNGTGTEENPFIITDQGELELVTDFPDCHFRLANDIELEGTWIPLCKQTSSGYFSGVFDGAGYTISNLVSDSSVGGLFKHNKGTIKNLNIIIANDGMTGSGTVCDINSGIISNCIVEGNIAGNYEYLGGICAYNKKEINKCKFIGNVENNCTSFDYTGGICGYNDDDYYNTFSLITNCAVKGNIDGGYRVGGICGHNYDYITNCYFIGNLSGGSLGGIAAQNSGYHNGSTSALPYRAHMGNCFAVPTFVSNSAVYGISYHSSGTFSACYYDKTVSSLTDTSNGTPKSTTAMKMQATYTNWDFENIWGIDENINDGYPYLLWQYPNVEEKKPYTVNSIKLTDFFGNELSEIPNKSFYLEINVTKNDDSNSSDCLVIACYDESGSFTDLNYMSGTYYQNQTVTFGTMISNINNNVSKIVVFVWDDVLGMVPLSNQIEITN